MGKRLMHEYLLAKGGISKGSHITYAVDDEYGVVFRTTGCEKLDTIENGANVDKQPESISRFQPDSTCCMLRAQWEIVRRTLTRNRFHRVIIEMQSVLIIFDILDL